MRIVAASSHLIPDFEPTGFSSLPDPDVLRLYITDGETSVIGSLYPPASALQEDTEQLAAALLRSLVPGSAVKFPEVLGTMRVSGPDWGLQEEHELVFTRPLPGTPLTTGAFADFPALVDDLAVFLATLHASDTAAVADAGLVAEEPLEVRDSLLADLDRGAATGRVPHTLLQRWETVLETAGVWHFLPAVLHGNLGVDALRSEGPRVVAVTDLDQLRVGDPALDLAAAADLLGTEDFSRLLDGYQRQRGTDDPHLLTRIGLISELSVLQLLLTTVDSGDEQGADEAVALLEQLAELGDADLQDTGTVLHGGQGEAELHAVDLGPADPGRDTAVRGDSGQPGTAGDDGELVDDESSEQSWPDDGDGNATSPIV